MSYKNNKTNNKTWRKRNNSTWQKGKKRYYKQFEKGAYNGRQIYTIREINMIINKKYSDRVIAAKIGRSVKAIQVKRTRLNKILKNKKILYNINI